MPPPGEVTFSTSWLRACERAALRAATGRPGVRLVFRVNVLLPHPPKPRRRPCIVQGLVEEDAMRKLGLNEKRARVKTVRRQHWAKRLISPFTLKTVMAVGRLAVQLLTLVYSIIKVFRQ